MIYNRFSSLRYILFMLKGLRDPKPCKTQTIIGFIPLRTEKLDPVLTRRGISLMMMIIIIICTERGVMVS